MRRQANSMPDASRRGRARHRRAYFVPVALAALGVALTLAVGTASASKQVVDYFGTESATGTLGGEFNSPQGVAVNNSGAGPANKGDIYVVDNKNNRIQRFGRDDHGTPAAGSDDTYAFISAWGAGVDSGVGGSGYQICTVASQCQAGIASGGNGALGNNGSLREASGASGIAVDQDTGEVYVSDARNFRVNVYSGDGTFLRSFGYDVAAAGPGQVSGPDEVQQLRVKANGGHFSLSFRGKATAARGMGHRNKGSSTVTQVIAAEGTFTVGQGVSGQAIPPGTTVTGVEAGVIKLSHPATNGTENSTPLFGDNFAHDASAAEIEAALNALPSIGGVGGSVTVTGGPGDESGSTPYTIHFGGSLAGQALPPIIATQEGLTIGSGSASATVSTSAEGGAYEVCNAVSGDICKAGGVGVGVGEVGEGEVVAAGIAVSQPDGNPATGTVFLADTGNQRINTYNLDGSSPGSFGAGTFTEERPQGIAVDSRGIVYASNWTPLSGNEGKNEIERYDGQNANGEGVGFLAPIAAPPLDSQPFQAEPTHALAVDPDSDGAGPDADILYVLRGADIEIVQQFGPLNAPGLVTPPAAADEEHGALLEIIRAGGVAFDESTGRLYVTAQIAGKLNVTPRADGVYVLDNAGPPPTASLDSLSDVTATTVTANATIDPNGPPALSYHLEYSLDGTNWKAAPSVLLGSQETPQSVNAVLDPPGGGLEPGTFYHVRLVAVRPFSAPIVTSELTFTTLAAPPIAETTGSPVRSATTARLDSRVTPRGSATTYHFEYGTEGPCGANPCTSTEAHPAGSGGEVELVSQQVADLEPSTTYHYRVVADNGNPGSPVSGEDMTLTTLASDAPLSHGHLPGPPGSDRAWEQVNQPDTGGNPVFGALGFADSGNRALFRIAGGTPISQTGSLFAMFYSERTSAGWQVKQISPPRGELIGGDWEGTTGTPDLSTVVSANTDFTTGEAAVWSLDTGGAAPNRLFKRASTQEYIRDVVGLSSDARTVLVRIAGGADPAYPEAVETNLYEIGSGSPRLASVLPNGSVGCVPNMPPQSSHWVSADGSHVFFPNCNFRALYMRNLQAGETKLISGPPLSGQSCDATFLKSTPGAAFFWTQSRLAAQDTNPPGNCQADGDIYRYDLGDGSLKCVTCAVPGIDANVSVSTSNLINGNAGPAEISVADDGSRVYFKTTTHLAPGAPDDGAFGAYRVNVATGELAFVAAIGSDRVGELKVGGQISPDGSVFTFRASAEGFNATGGQQNGGTIQYYRYDDHDRSLVCVSCPQDDEVPKAGAGFAVASGDGNIVAFATPTPLSSSDQNTAAAGQDPQVGQDVYEWRDGRLVLVTDGLTNWSGAYPEVSGIGPNGRDIFFLAATQYTQDALDGYQRLYDARIGGGFEFPKPPPPCPLEVCQGTPKGAPEEQAPGSGSFSGPGNAPQQKRHHKKKSHKKAHKKSHKSSKRHAKQQANDNRRTAR